MNRNWRVARLVLYVAAALLVLAIAARSALARETATVHPAFLEGVDAAAGEPHRMMARADVAVRAAGR